MPIEYDGTTELGTTAGVVLQRTPRRVVKDATGAVVSAAETVRAQVPNAAECELVLRTKGGTVLKVLPLSLPKAGVLEARARWLPGARLT